LISLRFRGTPKNKEGQKKTRVSDKLQKKLFFPEKEQFLEENKKKNIKKH
jgi:hypothetical protein